MGKSGKLITKSNGRVQINYKLRGFKVWKAPQIM